MTSSDPRPTTISQRQAERIVGLRAEVAALTEQRDAARATLDALAGCDVCRVCAGIAAEARGVSDDQQ